MEFTNTKTKNVPSGELESSVKVNRELLITFKRHLKGLIDVIEGILRKKERGYVSTDTEK